jgi:hypothetical protein
MITQDSLVLVPGPEVRSPRLTGSILLTVLEIGLLVALVLTA